MVATNYWDRFPKADESKNQDHPSDYWGQFPKADDRGAKERQPQGLELEGVQPSNDPILSHDQGQGLGQNPSFLDKAKRLGGIAAHGFAEGVGGLADLA